VYTSTSFQLKLDGLFSFVIYKHVMTSHVGLLQRSYQPSN